MLLKPKKCRICGSSNLFSFLDLGPMPLPNGFLTQDSIKEKEPVFSLTVGICNRCFLMQLVDIVSPKLMFKNYVYIPSASKTRLENFKQISEELIKNHKPTKYSMAVDIGSNDGSLLLEFKKLNIKTVGVDPAENLSKIAILKGINTLNTYFTHNVAKKIKKEMGTADYITATNVVAHINDLHNFFIGIHELLSSEGIFLCEFPYVLDLLQKNLFDTIYQEHLSYFAVGPLLKIIKEHKLKVISIRRTAMDGGALRLLITRRESRKTIASVSIDTLLKLEKKSKLNDLATYRDFEERVTLLKKDIRKTLISLKQKGKSIAAYGAAARGNILLNYCKIGRGQIDFIVDSTPYKQGLYTPGTKIQILPEEVLYKRKPDYVLILAWNFAEEIMNKQKRYKQEGGKFIIPVPRIKIF